MFKLLLSLLLATLIAVSYTGKAMSIEKADFEHRYLENCQRQIKKKFRPPSWNDASRYRADNKAVIRFKLHKGDDDTPTDILLVSSSGDPEFTKQAEHAVRYALYRPNLLDTDPIELECTLIEHFVTVKLVH